MNREGMLLVLACLLVMCLAMAATAQAQMLRPDQYEEQVQKKYLEPNGLDYATLDGTTQARVIGYALGMDVLAARLDYEKIEQARRLLNWFRGRLGRNSEESKQMFAAYIGWHDAEMRTLLGGAAPEAKPEEEQSDSGFFGRLKKK